MSEHTELSPGARVILDAASESFARGGFDSVSLNDVAVKAKVSKANIFHHFKSKEALYVEVIREACKGHAEFTENLLGRAELASTEKLRRLIVFDFDDVFGNEQRSRLVLREIFNTGCRTGRKLVEPIFIRNYKAVTELIRQGQVRGEFRHDIKPAVVSWILGSTVMMFFQNRDSLDQFPGLAASGGHKAYADLVFRTILNGVLQSPAIGSASPSRRSRATAPKSRKTT